jgi:antitoxin MazE
MSDLRCDWDPAKASANLRKHGVGFEEVRTAFIAYLKERAARPAERFLAQPRCRDYNVVTTATIAKIVRIGNSRGIRVPKALLEQAQLPEEVELQAGPGRLIVRAARRTRAGWAEAAAQMHARGDDRLLELATGNRFDREEWAWH